MIQVAISASTSEASLLCLLVEALFPWALKLLAAPRLRDRKQNFESSLVVVKVTSSIQLEEGLFSWQAAFCSNSPASQHGNSQVDLCLCCHRPFHYLCGPGCFWKMGRIHVKIREAVGHQPNDWFLLGSDFIHQRHYQVGYHGSTQVSSQMVVLVAAGQGNHIQTQNKCYFLKRKNCSPLQGEKVAGSIPYEVNGLSEGVLSCRDT